MFLPKRILILAPHTDDGELGCGATISKLHRMGSEIFYLAFSACEDSLKPDEPKDMLRKELRRATAVLKIPSENVQILNYRVRHFPESRQNILDDIIKIGRDIKPDTVFLPSLHDIHQDHQVIANEGIRAFKRINILSYELPWNNLTFNNQMFSRVDEIDVQKKIDAMTCYESQIGRPYATPDYLRSVLLAHGVQAGTLYAEVFEVPRFIF